MSIAWTLNVYAAAGEEVRRAGRGARDLEERLPVAQHAVAGEPPAAGTDAVHSSATAESVASVTFRPVGTGGGV